MKNLWFALFLLPALAAQPSASPKPAVLEGKAVDSVTGAPLRKTDVTLTTNLMPEGMDEMAKKLGLDFGDPAEAEKPKAPRRSYAATTDAAGKFRIENVDPGNYYLTAKHSGYGDERYVPKGKYESDGQLHLSSGDQLTTIEFKLVPHGAISGRVVDEDGDPVPDGMVSAMSYSFSGGRRRLTPADTAQTNERGEFRLGKLPPGHYVVGAERLAIGAMMETPAAPKDGSPETAYVLTYFPQTTDVAQAQVTDVKPASDIPGLVIHMQKSRVVRVKGKLAAADGTPIKSAQVMLMAGARPGSMRMSMVNNPEGKFELANLAPGTYMAMVMQMGGDHGPAMTMQPLIVSTENMENVKLGSSPEGKLQGRIVVNGDAPGIVLKKIRITLVGADAAPIMPAWGQVAESGAFTIGKVANAPYEVGISGVPAGAYLKSVIWSGHDMLGKTLDFTGGAAGDLQVVLGVDGGQVEATVMHDDKPAPDATVVLLPADPARRFGDTVHNETADAAGHVTFRDIAPGDYVVYAWEKVDDDAWFDPDFLKPVEARGVKLSLGAKGSEKVQVTLIPR